MTRQDEMLDTIDLELLRTLEAVYLERNVARAAVRLDVSQPLVSQHLTKLRLLLKDQLFIRAPQGVAPTELTLSLAPAVHRSLNELREALVGTRQFDAATTARQFVIHMSDSAELAYLVPLYKYVREAAPNVTLRAVRLSADLVASALDNQQIHLALASLPQIGSEFERVPLVTQHYQLAMGISHPYSARPIDVADLQDLDFLMIGNFPDVETMMAEQGLTGRIRHRIGHYLAAPLLLGEGRLVAWLPEAIIKPFSVFGAYHAVSLPELQRSFSVSLIRTRRSERDPGIQWLWDTIVRLTQQSEQSIPLR
jgi:DNA-binding transcriptional LysR family regulator